MVYQKIKPCFRSNQNGAVLVVSLIILLVLTLIVFASSSNVILQENMTGSLRQSSQLFQVAESTLREAEQRLSQFNDLSEVGVSPGIYSAGAAPSDYFDNSLWDSDIDVVAVDSLVSGISAHYFIEFVGEQELVDSVEDVQVNNSYVQVETIVSTAIFRVVVRAKLDNSDFSKVVSSYYSTTL